MHLARLTRAIFGIVIAALVLLVLAACTSAPAAPTVAPTTAAPKPTAAAAPTTAATAAAPTAAAKPTTPPAVASPAIASPAAASPTAAAAAKPTIVPKPQPAAVSGQQLIVLADAVRGPAGLKPEETSYLSCVQSNRYPQGAQIVWRVRVMDPKDGKAMDDKVLKSVTLTLPDGKTQTLRYSAHGGDDAFWTTSYTVPDNYPTGSFKYNVEAADNTGRTGSNIEFVVGPSQLQIVAAGQR